MKWLLAKEIQPADEEIKWVYCKETNSFHKAIFKNGKWYNAITIYSQVLEVSHWINEAEFNTILPAENK